jgi:hypothetical protein
MFAMIGGSKNVGFDNILPPALAIDPLPVQQNCGCKIMIINAKIICDENDKISNSARLKVAWETDCATTNSLQLVIYILKNESYVKPFINYMHQSKKENKLNYNHYLDDQQSIQSIEKSLVENKIEISLQNISDSNDFVNNGNYSEMVFSITSNISRKMPLVADVQTISEIIFNHQFNKYVPMSSFYTDNTYSHDSFDQNMTYERNLKSIVDISCTENCSVIIGNLNVDNCTSFINATTTNYNTDENGGQRRRRLLNYEVNQNNPCSNTK